MEWDILNELNMETNLVLLAYAIFFAIGVLSVKKW